MPWGAVAGAVIGAVASNNASNKAADAQKSASNASIAEQRREYDLTRQDQMPWLQAGGLALGRQQNFLNGDWSGFENSPDYKYALSQGLDSIDHRAAARGGLFGGGNTRDAMQFASGLATQNANSYYSKLAGLSQTGSNTAQNLGQLGMGMANSIGNAYTNAGNARASAYQQQGQNWAGLAQGLGNLYTQGRQSGWNWGG
jgi:hypothetical protein